jgi:hypothetical protein
VRATIPRGVALLGQIDWLVIDGRDRRLELWRPFAATPNGRALYVLRPRTMRPAATPHGRGARLWRRWHGHRAERAWRLAIRHRRFATRVGRVLTIGYTYYGPSKRRGEPRFHPFDTPPTLWDLGGGNYAVRGGRFRVTPRGIVG